MNWAEEFIRRALAGIPNSAYKNRLRGELAEHLALLASDLEAAGRGPEEAQAEALRQMGDAEALCEDYRAEWLRQPESRRWDLVLMVYGCLIAGLCSFFAGVVLGVLWEPGYGYLRNAPIWIAGIALYLSAAVPNALFLRKVFRGRARQSALMIAGLLFTWCIGKGLMLLGFGALYGHVFPLPAYNGRLFGTPDGYQVKGSFRWFTYSYMAWTFATSPLLGWLFSLWKEKKRRNDARQRTLTIIGCVCFGLSAAVNVSHLIQYQTFGGMLGALIYLLLVAALAFRSPLLLTASGILLAAECVIGAVTDYGIFLQTQNLVLLIRGALDMIASVLILLLGLSKRRSVGLGWAAGVLVFLKALLALFGWLIPALHGMPQELTLPAAALPAAAMVGWIVTGYLRRGMPTVGEAWKKPINR